MMGIRAWMLSQGTQRLALYLAFLAYGLVSFMGAPGDDLSSSYMACRLLASGEGSHIYDFHPELFHVVDSPAWVQTAATAQFQGFLHPYVQTPLWAWSLQPICTQLSFDTFKQIFLCMTLLCLIGTIEMVAHAWARKFLRPLPLALLLAAVAVSTPFSYAMWLVQTHALFLLLTVAALLLANRNRPTAAGTLLAVACAVKITPGLLLIYWLVGGRYRAARAFILSSAALLALTVAAAGPELTLDYLRSMRRVSDVLLVSFNNQSFPAWMAFTEAMGRELGNWRMLALAPSLKALSLLGSVAGMAVTGAMSKRDEWAGFSAAVALIVITVFSPIAWTHYFLVLIPAVMVLVDVGGPLFMATAVITFLLNARPLALDPITTQLTAVTMVRSHFFSAVFVLLCVLGWCFKQSLDELAAQKAAK